MDEKLRFVFEHERDEESMTALCERFRISRETGYVWLRRYRQSGLEGLVEVNWAALCHPNQTPEADRRTRRTDTYSVGESSPSSASRTIFTGGNPCFRKSS
jgi:transposase-like protein